MSDEDIFEAEYLLTMEDMCELMAYAEMRVRNLKNGESILYEEIADDWLEEKGKMAI